jgi:hypothetical protein
VRKEYSDLLALEKSAALKRKAEETVCAAEKANNHKRQAIALAGAGGIPNQPTIQAGFTNGQVSKDYVDLAIARCFLVNGFSARALESSPEWNDAVAAIKKAPPNYKSLGRARLNGPVLDALHQTAEDNVTTLLASAKENGMGETLTGVVGSGSAERTWKDCKLAMPKHSNRLGAAS